MRALCNSNIVCEHAKCTIPGAIIECGVYDGVTSLVLRDALPDRQQYACDTFEGMPYDGSELECAGGFVKGYLSLDNPEETIETLRLRGICVLKGRVEDMLPDTLFSFAFLDLDMEAPTRIAAEFLEPRIKIGGRIGFHDYLERPGYCLGGIAKIVNEIFIDNPRWIEAFRAKGTRDARFIFFERIKD